MENKRELSDYVREKLAEKGLSTYDVQKASGNRISAATVTKIMNRDVRSSSIETLTGLAAGLGVSAEEVINIARGLPPNLSRFDIYADRFDAHDLSDSEWEMLEVYFNDHVKAWKKFQQDRLAGKFVSDPNEKKKK